MNKEYYKLKDINEDIWSYKAMLRKLDPSSSEYSEVLKFLHGLKLRRKALMKINAGNESFFSKSIAPQPKKYSHKQKLLNELYREQNEENLRHEIATSLIQGRIEEIKNLGLRKAR